MSLASGSLPDVEEMVLFSARNMLDDLEKVLFHESTILARLDELAAEITRDYRGKPLTVLAVLHGSLVFLADLLRRIPLPLEISCVVASSYHGGTQSTGSVRLSGLDIDRLQGRHVLILDDILDSGLTLDAICSEVMAQARPLDTRICVLLAKRKVRACAIKADYAAFEIGDEFVVGYGLDFAERYRNLPCIGILRQDVAASCADSPLHKTATHTTLPLT